VRISHWIGSEDRAPKLDPDGSGAPEFRVTFSRPAQLAGRPDSPPNTFRWAGLGTLHILERGLLVIAKRRFPLGFHIADERFVPASEICDVYREGPSVRVELRAAPRSGAFFQFWTDDAAAAATIVRLLPTTRTIEYEGPSGRPVPVQKTHSLYRPGVATRAIKPIAVVVAVGLMGIASWMIANRVPHRPRTDAVAEAQKLAIPTVNPSDTSVARQSRELQRTTAAELAAATAYLARFDDRMDGLRSEHMMAFTALQSGNLSQQAFINGLHQWLIPQWRALYGELISKPPPGGSLDSRVRRHLIDAALGWDEALAEYGTGLQERNLGAVLKAFDRMSAAHAQQREARRLIDREEP
jgi:hypothetical protein